MLKTAKIVKFDQKKKFKFIITKMLVNINKKYFYTAYIFFKFKKTLEQLVRLNHLVNYEPYVFTVRLGY